MKLIASKITIPNETPSVCRQGLLDTLRENLKSCHATVINGRAGTGKTMLAIDFVRRYVRRSAWYKVDAPDMSLPVFIEYLVASVARVRPGFGRQTLKRQAQSFGTGEIGMAGVGGESDVAGLAEAFVYDLERQAEPLVLTIDDLHLIYDADWVIPFFHRLLLLIPTNVHMLILGRGLPPARRRRVRPLSALAGARPICTPRRSTPSRPGRRRRLRLPAFSDRLSLGSRGPRFSDFRDCLFI